MLFLGLIDHDIQGQIKLKSQNSIKSGLPEE